MRVWEQPTAPPALPTDGALFAAFMAHSPAVAFIKDAAGRYVYVNPPFERLFGRTLAETVGRDDFAVWPPATAAQLRAHDAAVLAGDAAVELVEEVPTPDGALRHWSVYKFPLVDRRGRRHLAGMAVDITGRVRAEARLRALHDAAVHLAAERDPRRLVPQLLERAAALLGAGSASFYTWDGPAGTLRCAHNWRVPAGDTTPDQRPGEGLAGWVYARRRTLLVNDYPGWAGAMPSGLAAGLRAALAAPLERAGALLGVVVVRAYDAATRFAADDARLLELFADQAAVALENARLHDLAQAELAERRRIEAALRASEARLAHLAAHDPLTGLPNRRYLAARLGESLARLRRSGEPVALLYLDLDGFKGVNDALGHEAGDYLLGEVGDRLRACVRAGDTVARLGGDEFAVLLEGMGAAEARAVAARLVAVAAVPVPIGAATATVGCSVGVALAAPGERADDLLRRADDALYAAKRGGKNRYALAP